MKVGGRSSRRALRSVVGEFNKINFPISTFRRCVFQCAGRVRNRVSTIKVIPFKRFSALLPRVTFSAPLVHRS